MPQSDAGTRIEPLVSEPSASGDEPAGDGGAGAARGAPGHAVDVVRVARRTVVDVLAGEIVGVLAHVERADQHRTGGFQSFDQNGVARRRRVAAVDLGARARRETGDIEQVLDSDRNSGERAEGSTLRMRVVDCARPFAGAIGEDGGEGIEDGIALRDPGERRVDDGGRACLAFGDSARDARLRQSPGGVDRRSLQF